MSTTYLETPEMKLIAQLCAALNNARECLLKKEPDLAMAEIDYALQCIISDSFFEHPEMLRRTVVDTSRPVVCTQCGGYVPGHATGNFDICTCACPECGRTDDHTHPADL